MMESFSLDSSITDISKTIGENNNIAQQIAELEELNAVLERQIDERREMYTASLNSLRKAKDKEIKQFQEDFEQQENEQNLEFSEQKRIFEEQIKQVQNTTKNTENDMLTFKKYHDMFVKVNKEIEKTNFMSELVDAEATIMMETAVDSHNAETRATTEKEKRKSLKLILENLEQEILSYKQNISIQRENHNRTIREIDSTIEIQRHHFEISKKNIFNEMKKRDGFFAKHLGIVERAIKNEAEKTKNEVASLETQVKYMYEIRRETSKKYTTLMMKFSRDIEKMQAVLANSEHSNSSQESKTMESLSRSDEALKNVEELRQKEASLEEELQKVTTQIENSFALLQKLNNAEKANKSPYRHRI